MANQLVSFQFHSHEVRTSIDDNSNFWFVAKDVCRCLDIKDTSDAVSKIPYDEKGKVSTLTLGGSQELLCVNEPGLYRLIFTSRKPEAEAFKNWVFHEVLPTIRKTGSYNPNQLTPQIHTAIHQAAQQAVRNQLSQRPQVKSSRYLEDTEQVFQHFVTSWFGTFGTRPRRVKELQPVAKEVGVFKLLFAETLDSECKRLGQWLTRNRGRVIAGFVIIRTHDTLTGKHAYRLQREQA